MIKKVFAIIKKSLVFLIENKYARFVLLILYLAIFPIIGLITAIVYLFIKTTLKRNLIYVIGKFNQGNIIFFGAKGKGKDLAFQNVIRIKQKKAPYVSNMDYGSNLKEIISFKDLTVAPNTYENLIQGKYIKIPPRFEWTTDAFMSDAGIYLPSHFDNKLSKDFPSLPILYALSRQLYKMNIHLNTQALNRVWIKLREQADGYFKALKTISVPFVIFQKVRYFEHYESANRNVLPFKHKIMNKENNALADQFTATNGLIRDMWLVIPKSEIIYDTYWFRKLLIIEDHEKEYEEDQKKSKLVTATAHA